MNTSTQRAQVLRNATAVLLLCGCPPAEESVDGGSQQEPSPQGMVTAACGGGRCASRAVVDYWRDVWSTHAQQRVVTFSGDATAGLHMGVTDPTGAAAALTFQAGVPVTLTVRNPGPQVTGRHYLSAPDFFHTAAWRKVETVDAEYKAPYFYAVGLAYDPATTTEVELQFIPMAPGTWTAYCQLGVTGGDQYEDIIAGLVTPDTATGHAGHGMTLPITVTGDLGVTLDQGVSGWNVELGRDARRNRNNPVWVNADGGSLRDETYADPPVMLQELSDTAMAFSPSAINLVTGRGYAVGLANPSTNMSSHYFTAPEFMRSVVLRGVEDRAADIRAPYLSAIELVIGGSARALMVPTVAGTFTAYCNIGVAMQGDQPDLHTGHAGMGAVATVAVTDP